MIDPKTGRIRRGPGEPARFRYKDVAVPAKSILRAAWIKQQTGYEVDPRAVFITEALRAPFFKERPAFMKAQDTRPATYFKPDIMELRTSERKTFGTCHYQWWWRYVERLTPARAATPLWFGAAVHEALAAYYLKGKARGPHPAETFTKVLDGDRKMYVDPADGEDGELKFEDARTLGIAMMNHYVDTYGEDSQWDVLTTEETFTLLFKRGGQTFLRYLLTLDGLVRDLATGQIFIIEHKTFRSLNIFYLPLDNQAGSYYAAAPHVLPLAELLKPKEFISGILYNFLRKAIKDDRPQNAEGRYTNKPTKAHYIAAFEASEEIDSDDWSPKMKLEQLEALAKSYGWNVLGDESKTQPPKYFHREPVFRTPAEQTTQLERIQKEAHYMEQMRAGNPDFPILKTPGDHCAWCPFKHMCELHESGDDDAVESFKATVMIEEDPYLAYRIHPKAA